MNIIERHKAKFLPKDKTGAVKTTVEFNPRQEGKTHEKISREYEVLKQLVHADYQRLKNTPDDGTRHKQQKTTLLNNYREYLTGWMAAGEQHNNDVLFFNIVWAADVGQWDWLLKMTDYAVMTGQTNTVFKSNAETVASREIYYHADRLLKEPEFKGIRNNEVVEEQAYLPACFFEAFERVTTDKWHIPTELLAKFYKVAGIDADVKGDLAKAKEYYAIADDIYPNVAVKSRLKKVTESLNEPHGDSSTTQ